MPVADKPTMQSFLENDLYDSLRWLFEGALAWEAARRSPQTAGHHQIALGMFTSLVQARALYEFFCDCGKGDDARAAHFGFHAEREAAIGLYSKYMSGGKPANKRVFHLVYDRSSKGGDEQAPLNAQVLEFAREIRRLTEEFAKSAHPDFRESVKSALQRALGQAELAAKHYGISNPL